MALRFTSILTLCLLSAISIGQSFGRFGYGSFVELPGLRVDKEGFVATDPSATKILFPAVSSEWKPTVTSQVEQGVLLDEPTGGPSKAGFNLIGLGFSLYFPSGIDLHIHSTQAPYISWEQGTVTENVRTPASKWLILSFQNKQPAIVMAFPGGQATLIVTGKPGAWELKSFDKFSGWMHIALPRGLQSDIANTAESLGVLAEEAAKNAPIWTSPTPRLINTTIESDLHSVTATWHFDRPGAVVPPPAMLSNLGKYLIQVKSPTKRLPGWTDLGPTDVLMGTDLTIRFPVKRIPTGRSLTIGIQQTDAIGTVSPLDIPSVAELALDSLVAGRDVDTRKAASDTSNEFVNEVNFTPEPWTKQQLPYDARGKGIDLAAAHAFLIQATTSTAKASSESNAMLTSVSWRQDWLTWRVWASDENLVQRTGALAALAGAFCPEPERRLSAALFQAGLSGLRGLHVWMRRKGLIAAEPKLLEPLYGFRKGIFGFEGPPEDGESFALSLLSPIRVFSDQPVELLKNGSDYILQWTTVDIRPAVIVLASAYAIEASRLTNLTSLKVEQALGFTELHYTPEASGPCGIKIVLPAYAVAPIDLAPIPKYKEVFR